MRTTLSLGLEENLLCQSHSSPRCGGAVVGERYGGVAVDERYGGVAVGELALQLAYP